MCCYDEYMTGAHPPQFSAFLCNDGLRDISVALQRQADGAWRFGIWEEVTLPLQGLDKAPRFLAQPVRLDGRGLSVPPGVSVHVSRCGATSALGAESTEALPTLLELLIRKGRVSEDCKAAIQQLLMQVPAAKEAA
ncbi:hypothetical protein DB347_17720 [Opitutaceae bacterium EW11]|nr:hypothetical protein DB347_17720 [Opitutaceae bacterium EW11]